MIASDALSTHDKVRGVVPFKGQILTQLSNDMLDIVQEALPHSQIAAIGRNIVVAENCEPIKVEMVLRKYMAKSTTETSLYHHYVNLGEREFCGHKLPEGLRANEKLPYLMDTPSTKSEGHDTSVTPKYLFDNGFLSPEEYDAIRNACIEAFGRGAAVLEQRGIILVDTKFEIGRNREGKIVFIDELLTQDASRYWIRQDYEEKFAKGEEPTSYSKQLARDIGDPKQPYTEEEIKLIAERYFESYELLTGKKFQPDIRDPIEQIVDDINKGLEALV